MKNEILIITSVEDSHAYIVQKALEEKGVMSTLWHSSDFPAQGNETIEFTNNKQNLIISDMELEIKNLDFKTIWLRRPSFTINKNLLHTADQAYATYQCQSFRNSLFNVLSPNSFWVNPRDNAKRANSKIYQNKIAIETGFNTPASLYSNDSKQIREFIQNNNGTVVFKPLLPILWETQEFVWTNFTELIGEKDLVEDEVLRATPAIYQEVIPKDYELRITVMGKHVFGAKIFSQETNNGKLDWRQSYEELRIDYWDVPNNLSNQCIKFLQKLGLVFGCFDFIVTPKGEWVFLEVNQMGQFLFLEHYMEFPLLDAFTEFLIQGKVDFNWKVKDNAIRYKDLELSVDKYTKRAQNIHSITKYIDINKSNKERIVE